VDDRLEHRAVELTGRPAVGRFVRLFRTFRPLTP
jgi:hypothetical protein